MLDLNAEYKVISYLLGDTKAGTKMGKLQLKNMNDNTVMNCILWEETVNRLDSVMFKTGNIVKITTGTYNEKYNNCLITNMKLIEEAKAGITEEIANEHFDYLISLIDGFKNEELKTFVKKTLVDNKEKFLTAPAAKVMHHNYIGGLIVHIVECTKIADTLHPLFYQKIDKEILLSACILHDIGKIFEYDIDLTTGFIDYNSNFRKDWISHSQYGFSLCMANNQPMIAKMIASHHGRIDWGAMIDLSEKDLEPYYYIVHHIDDISAKFGKINVGDL